MANKDKAFALVSLAKTLCVWIWTNVTSFWINILGA